MTLTEQQNTVNQQHQQQAVNDVIKPTSNNNATINDDDKENISDNTTAGTTAINQQSLSNKSTDATNTELSLQDNRPLEVQYAEAIQLSKNDKFAESSEIFSRLCDKYVSKYGEDSIEIADVYYQYGKNLIELAKSKSSVLGNVENNDTDMNDNNNDNDNAATTTTTITVEDDNIMDEDDTQQSALAAADNSDDLDIANEVLEIARIIIEKKYNEIKQLNDYTQYDKEKDLVQRLVDIKQCIGDIYTETENFELAYKEYQSCIEYISSYHKPWNRDIAIYHQNMGMIALFMSDRAPSALINYTRMAYVFNYRIQHIIDDVLVNTNNSTYQRFTLPITYADVQKQYIEQDKQQQNSNQTTNTNTKTVVITPETQRALSIYKTLKSTLSQDIQDEINDCVEILNELRERIADIEQQIETNFDTTTTIQQTLNEIRPQTTVGFNNDATDSNNLTTTSTTSTSNNSDDVVSVPVVKRKKADNAT